ncbi:MAG: outer membrane protein [Candidatus Polarisedimenticolia bacterium]
MRNLSVRWIVLSAVLLAAGAWPALAEAEGHANFYLGFKQLDEDDWEPVDDQFVFGAEISIGQTGWPVMIAIDPYFAGSSEEEAGFDINTATSELAIGVRKIWDFNGVHPYVGGGPSLLSGALEVEGPFGGDVDDSDSTLGLWAGGGIFWRLGSRFNIGVSLRWSTGEVELFDVDVQAGGLQGGLLLGWGWPGK